jgi:hypothetical protein
MLVAERRRGMAGPVPPDGKAGPGRLEVADPVRLHQFVRSGSETRPRSRAVPTHERPPARTVKGVR